MVGDFASFLRTKPTNLSSESHAVPGGGEKTVMWELSRAVSYRILMFRVHSVIG